jgi:putative DeoR family transcriptional regulator (stage III sporulation protein D)
VTHGVISPEFGTKQERCVSLGKYIIDHHATVRDTANVFGISKSTVHQDVTARLEKVNPALYKEVKKVLDKNKQERHIRGGQATKLKYINAGSQKG